MTVAVRISSTLRESMSITSCKHRRPGSRMTPMILQNSCFFFKVRWPAAACFWAPGLSCARFSSRVLAGNPRRHFEIVRLLGKQPMDSFHDRNVALVFLASHAIEPMYSYAFQELRCEIHEDQFRQEGPACSVE